MKRPLFWAVVMFALGEVAGLFVRTWRQLGIAIAMLVCVGPIFIWVISKTQVRHNSKSFFWILIMLPIGCIYSPLRSGNYQVFQYGKYCHAVYGCNMSDLIWQGDDTKAVTIWGTVKTINQGANVTSAVVSVQRLELQGMKNSKQPFLLGKYVLVSPLEAVSIGDELLLQGKISQMAAAENPGQFDMQKYYQAREIRYRVKPDQVERLQEKNSLKKQLMIAKAYLRAYIYENADEETATLYTGILLGDKTAIADDVKGLFACAGISHILSISALHISLIAMTFYKLLRRFGARFFVACPCAFVLIFFYGTLTGWPFSAVRAAIMLWLVFLGELLGRKVDLLTSAAVALLLMSLKSPYMLFDSGVCIGFAAVFGIAIGQAYNRLFLKNMKEKQQRNAKVYSRIQRRRKLLFQKFCTAFIISACVYITTAPILARVYFSVSTYTIFVNLIVVPLMTVVVILGLIGLCFACIHLPVCKLFFQMGGIVLNLFKVICRLVIKLPGPMIKTGKITMLEIVLYYLLLAIAMLFSTRKFRLICFNVYHRLTYKWMDKRMWKKVLLGIYLLYLPCQVTLLVTIRMSFLKEELIFLSVGQGDGILIRTGNRCNIVIDGGSTSKDLIGENIMLPAIKSKAMHHIRYWFVSHADKDHISGLEEILDMGELAQIDIDYIVVAKTAREDEQLQDLVQKATEHNIKVIYMEQGDWLAGGDFAITCVAPSKGIDYHSSKNRNEQSLCLAYESRSFYALLTGDADAEEMKAVAAYTAENNMNARKINGEEDKHRIAIIKVPHHGSRYSCIEDYYTCFDVAVISSGRNNMYGHPHIETLELLEKEGCQVLRTDILGAIEF